MTQPLDAQGIAPVPLDLFSCAFSSAPIGMALVAPDGRLLTVNAALSELTGYGRNELLERDFQVLTHPDDLGSGLEHVNRVHAGQSDGFQLEKRYVRKDGTVLWALLNVSAVRWPTGEVRLFVAQIQDIGPRRRAEAELALFFRLSGDLLVVVDPQGIIERINDTWSRSLQWREDELVGRPVWSFLHPEDVDRSIREASALRRDRLRPLFINRFRHKDGSYRWLEWSGCVGPTGTILGSARDVTGRMEELDSLRRTSERLRQQAFDSKGMLGTLAHELRNALSAVNGVAAMLGSREPDGHIAGILKRQVGHLKDLVDDLTDAAAMATGSARLHRRVVDLTELILDATHEFEAKLTASSLQLRVEVPNAPVHIEADPVRLRQVIYNLLQNAEKFTAPMGCVTVKLGTAGDRCVLTVSDTGVGIAAENLQRIFELFEQAELPVRSSSTQGMGVGLRLVKRLVERHGGSVEAHSEGRGLGSELIVKLPLARRDAIVT